MKEIDLHVIEAAAEGRIDYQHCPSCGHDQAIAKAFCTSCLRPGPEWRTAGGDGAVVACTTIHRAPTPEWKARTPYAIALVDLIEGPRVMAPCATDLSPGDRVALRPGGRHGLPLFEKTETS